MHIPLLTMITQPAGAGPAATPKTVDALTDMVDTAHFLVGWFKQHSIDIALAIAAGAIIYLVLRAVRRFVRKAAARQADVGGFTANSMRVLARTRHFFLIMVAARLVIGYANPPELVHETVRVLFIIAATIQVAVWLREIIMTIIRQRAQDGSSDTLGNALALINILVSVALFAIAGIVILDNIGVNVTGLVAGLGIGGIAIGLAAKGIFEDLFAALAIIFDRPFRQGETVGFDGKTAVVERIGLKSTRLRALTGEEIIVSNTNLLNKELLNFASVPKRRIKLLFGVTYETPADKLAQASEIARAIVTKEGGTPVHCGIVSFGASSLDFELHYDDDNRVYADVFAARHAVILALTQQFAAAGIAFAYPTQVSYSASPEGKLVMPWPPQESAVATAS